LPLTITFPSHFHSRSDYRMVRQLLLTAALVAVAVSLGEYKMILAGCNCGDIMTYNLTTSAYCPLTSYKWCNISMMVEDLNDCSATCPGRERVVLVSRNNTAMYYPMNKLSCNRQTGILTTDQGKTIINPAAMRPTCAQKPRCNECPYTFQPTCASDKSCLESNIKFWTDENFCTRIQCNAGTLMLYNSSNPAQYHPYYARELFCTTAKTWTNYSYDGQTGGYAAPLTFGVNCVLPKTCENCPTPNLATDIAQLPVPFRAGYFFQKPIYTKAVGVCSQIDCPAGYKLYGFNSTSETVTGLEYTGKGPQTCGEFSKWQNGGLEYSPVNLLTACLQVIPPPTTPSPCGTWDALPAVGGGEVRCEGTQPVVNCTDKKIQVLTTATTHEFDKMSFVAGKGWLSFDCDGTAKLWKTGTADIEGVMCKGFV
ncbi:hypothetical protein PMAYCL1PPCAC_16896, partial [Pristionchus mayeri]